MLLVPLMLLMMLLFMLPWAANDAAFYADAAAVIEVAICVAGADAGAACVAATSRYQHFPGQSVGHLAGKMLVAFGVEWETGETATKCQCGSL